MKANKIKKHLKTEKRTASPRGKTASWFNVILGLWLIISPFVLGYMYEPLAMYNDIFMGILIGGFAFYAAFEEKPAASWLNIAFGIWLFISPLVLNHNVEVAGSNEMIVGVFVVVLALVSGVSYRSVRSKMPGGRPS